MYGCHVDALRASIGVRLSKQAGDTNLSLPGMLADCRAVAARLGAEVVAEYVDDGTSGAVRDRPKHVAWLDDAVSGRVNVLIAPYTDRLTREGVNAAAMVLDVVEGKDPVTGRVVRPGVRLVTVDGLDSERDAESFRWRFVIAAEVARAERARIAARNRATRARLTDAGRYAGGPVPFGRRVEDAPDGKGKVLVEEEEESVLLADAAWTIINGGSMRAATRWMNTVSRTRSGREWQRSSLRATLLSASTGALMGRMIARGLRDALTPSAAPKARGGRPVRRLLTGGLASCASCGRKLTTSANRYVCMAYSSGEVCPAPVTVNARFMEAWAEARWLEALGDVGQTRTISASGPDDAELEDVLDEVEVVARAFASAAVDDLPDLSRRMAALRTREAALKARPRDDAFDIVVGTGQTWGEAWAGLDAEGRRALLRDTGFFVTVRPGQHGERDVGKRAEVEWR
jgi:DNA invertase Pin-like site-specific DNA recombinase